MPETEVYNKERPDWWMQSTVFTAEERLSPAKKKIETRFPEGVEAMFHSGRSPQDVAKELKLSSYELVKAGLELWPATKPYDMRTVDFIWEMETEDDQRWKSQGLLGIHD